MQNRSCLIVTASRGLRRNVTRALVSAGCTVEHTAPHSDSILQTVARGYDLYVLDVAEEPAVVREVLRLLYEQHQNSIPLLVSSALKGELLLEMLSHGLNNIIARRGGVTASAEVDEHELIVTCNKLFRRDVFGLEKYIHTWGVQVRERTLRSAAERTTAVAELEEFLQALQCHPSMIPTILTTADELLTNAIFNAPRDEDGNSKYGSWSRVQDLDLQDGEAVELRYACDGKYVALSVADQFGSLDRQILVHYMRHALTGVKGTMEEKSGGAGLGLHMVLNSITQLVFNVESGRRTEAIATFYVRDGSKGLRQAGRSFNIFHLS